MLTIEIPELNHFPFDHSREVVRKRASELNKIVQQVYKVQDWLKRERKYLQDNCIGHQYPYDPRDPGGGGGFCKDCGKENPR